jgi:hypothetical protein
MPCRPSLTINIHLPPAPTALIAFPTAIGQRRWPPTTQETCS